MAAADRQPRRFAPLDPKKAAEYGEGLPRLKGVVFDLDGTLCEPQPTMFAEMRTALSIPPPTDILTHASSLPPPARTRAHTLIRTIEHRYMLSQRPSPGLHALITYLTARNVPKAILTRNCEEPVRHLVDAFLPGEVFWPVVTRDFGGRLKPSPEGVWEVVGAWGCGGGEVVVVGDGGEDVEAGRGAGAGTVVVGERGRGRWRGEWGADLWVGRLDELIEIFENGFVGQVGRGDGEPDVEEGDGTEAEVKRK